MLSKYRFISRSDDATVCSSQKPLPRKRKIPTNGVEGGKRGTKDKRIGRIGRKGSKEQERK